MAYAFDPDQPGVRRLVEMARAMTRLQRVEILAPVSVAGEHLRRGDHVVLSAAVARMLVDKGLARPAA